MNKYSKQDRFLNWAGWLLIIVGLGGWYLGSSLAPQLNFGENENLAHLLVGIIMLCGVYGVTTAKDLKTAIIGLVGITALTYSIIGFYIPEIPFFSFETTDNIFHLFIAIFAFNAIFYSHCTCEFIPEIKKVAATITKTTKKRGRPKKS